MKTYENESLFVNNFAKDAKAEIKSNGNFEAEINGVKVVVAGMDNNNASKVTIYSCTVDGVEFKGSITALKKRLNVSYKKEYNRSAERTTKVVIKSDEELTATAKTAAERIKTAVTVLKSAASRYGLTRAELLERTDSVEAVVLESLIRQRDRAAEAKAEREAKATAEAAAKLASGKARLEKQLAELQAKLAKMQ